MTGDGIPLWGGSPPGCRCGGTLHYILQWTVVLDKVEVCRSDGAERNAEIAHNGNGFKKNFGKKNGGAPVEIDAAGVHGFDERTEEAEVVMSGRAERCAIGGGMHVRNVGTDGEMDGDGNFVPIGVVENAGGRVLRSEAARLRGQEFTGGFAIADGGKIGAGGDLIEVETGFGGHAELAFAEAGVNVFGSATA